MGLELASTLTHSPLGKWYIKIVHGNQFGQNLKITKIC